MRKSILFIGLFLLTFMLFGCSKESNYIDKSLDKGLASYSLTEYEVPDGFFLRTVIPDVNREAFPSNPGYFDMNILAEEYGVDISQSPYEQAYGAYYFFPFDDDDKKAEFGMNLLIASSKFKTKEYADEYIDEITGGGGPTTVFREGNIIVEVNFDVANAPEEHMQEIVEKLIKKNPGLEIVKTFKWFPENQLLSEEAKYVDYNQLAANNMITVQEEQEFQVCMNSNPSDGLDCYTSLGKFGACKAVLYGVRINSPGFRSLEELKSSSDSCFNEICAQKKNQDEKDICILNQAMILNKNICNQIRNNITKQECANYIDNNNYAFNGITSDFCYKLIHTQRANCFVNFMIITGNTSLCANIGEDLSETFSGSSKGNCYYSAARRFDIKSLCYSVTDEEDKARCLEEVK